MIKLIKRNKKILITAIIVAIICISGTAFAAYKYSASQVVYKNSKSVEDALNELYMKESIKSGEAFLISLGGNGIKLLHNYNPYGAYFTIVDLDFTDIDSFQYTYSLSTTNSAYQQVSLSDNNKTYLNISLSGSGLVEVKGAKNLIFSWTVANNNTGNFKVISYTKVDGSIHEL